jgi:hypothetical protein
VRWGNLSLSSASTLQVPAPTEGYFPIVSLDRKRILSPTALVGYPLLVMGFRNESPSSPHMRIVTVSSGHQKAAGEGCWTRHFNAGDGRNAVGGPQCESPSKSSGCGFR